HCLNPANVADKTTVVHVRTCKIPTDTDNVIGVSDAGAGIYAQADVEVADRYVAERSSTDRRVVVAARIAERLRTNGGVFAAGDIVLERSRTDGGVVVASDVAKKGECTIGRVVTAGIVKGKRVYSIGCVTRAGSIEQKRCSTGGRVVVCGVEIKRSSTNSGIEAASGDTRQRKCTNCCIPNARGETPKSVVPLRSGEVGIASIGLRDNGLCCLWDDKAGQQERNDK